MTMNQDNTIKRVSMTAAAVVFTAMLAACDDGPAEDAGEKIDDSVSEMKDSTKDAMNDAGNAIEDACEDVKDAADAENSNC